MDTGIETCASYCACHNAVAWPSAMSHPTRGGAKPANVENKNRLTNSDREQRQAERSSGWWGKRVWMEGKGGGTDACHSAGVRVSGGDFICVQDQYIYICVCTRALRFLWCCVAMPPRLFSLALVALRCASRDERREGERGRWR